MMTLIWIILAIYFGFMAIQEIRLADWSWNPKANFKAADAECRATRGNFGLGTLGYALVATLLMAVHVGIIFLMAQP